MIRGIPCQIHDANEYSFEHLLKLGWHLKPENIYDKGTTDEEEKILQKVESQWKKPDQGPEDETPTEVSKPKRKYVRRKPYKRKSVPLDK